MNAPFTAVHFATYEAAKRALNEISSDHTDDERLILHATAGAVAGGLASVVTTPLDVVKTQLQCQGICGCDRFKSGSISDVFRTIVRKDGYKGLVRGWAPRMLFHAPRMLVRGWFLQVLHLWVSFTFFVQNLLILELLAVIKLCACA